MRIEIEIDGDELTELADIISEVNREAGKHVITAEQWCNNLVNNTLRQRMRDEYVFAASNTEVTELKQKFGSVRDLRSQRKVIK